MTWLKNSKFKAHTLAFSLMILTSIGMILAVKAVPELIWGLLAVFALSNGLAMLTK